MENPEFQEYPKAMHGPDNAEVVVNSKEEEDALGEGWVDGHAYFAAEVEAVTNADLNPEAE